MFTARRLLIVATLVTCVPLSYALLSATEPANAQIPLPHRDVSVRVTRSTGSIIFQGTSTAVPFETSEFDTVDMFDMAEPTKLKVRIGGKYLIHANVGWKFNGDAGSRQLMIHLNDNPFAGDLGTVNQHAVQTQSLNTYQTVSAYVNLNTGDYVEILVLQHAGEPGELASASVGMVKVP